MESKKLKPAKQALADAIHKNGGWVRDHFLFATSNADCVVTLWVSMPIRDGNHFVGRTGNIKIDWRFLLCRLIDRLPNWHQTILSRDEYLTAYPERKVEVEMKSESEVAIKDGDWHKNGELPPVGEVCIFDPNGRTEFFDEKAISAIGKEVSIISHVKFKDGVISVAVFMCDTDGVAIVRSANETCFRPFRTERDKAIEEMMSVINKSDFSGTPHAIANEIAELMFEDGYRKEVK